MSAASPTQSRDIKEPANRPAPPRGKGAQAVFMDFNHTPREIVRVMAASRDAAERFIAQKKRTRRWLWLLFPAGIPFLLVDLALGYNFITFSLLSLVMWFSGFVGLILVALQKRPTTFGPKFEEIQTLIDTLRDDVSSKRTLIGWLDLTGFDQDSKQYQKRTSPSGRPVVYYRDEWLRLKTTLYDSNILRLSLIDKVKDRKGFYKRGRISGKSKYKSGSTHYQHQLSFSVTVNPETYQIQPFTTTSGAIPGSVFLIQSATSEGGRIVLKAATNKKYGAWDVLRAMRFGYNQLQPIKETT